MFGQQGDVLQPSEVLHKKAILVERGSFRPVTHVNVDMINSATAQFVQEPLVKGKDVIILMEITMRNLLSGGKLDAQDFLSRVDLLSDIGFTVLISNYSEYYRLTSYFRRYTKEMIGVALGINNLLEIFNEKYYENLEGGILESFGRLFRNAVKLYVYPMRKEAYAKYIVDSGANGTSIHTFASNVLINAKNVRIVERLSNLYAHLLENHYIECMVGFDTNILDIFSRDVLKKIKENDLEWEQMVPMPVAQAIKRRGLFGHPQRVAQTEPHEDPEAQREVVRQLDGQLLSWQQVRRGCTRRSDEIVGSPVAGVGEWLVNMEVITPTGAVIDSGSDCTAAARQNQQYNRAGIHNHQDNRADIHESSWIVVSHFYGNS
jgi:hypothetical protein